MFSKEEYQEALDSLECNAIQWASNHKYNEKHNFYIDSDMCDEMLKHSKVLQELVDLYPEYLELKAKTTPIKPEEVERNVYRCLSCEKIIIPIGERKIWHKHFTPSCPNCGRLQDWSENG